MCVCVWVCACQWVCVCGERETALNKELKKNLKQKKLSAGERENNRSKRTKENESGQKTYKSKVKEWYRNRKWETKRESDGNTDRKRNSASEVVIKWFT